MTDMEWRMNSAAPLAESLVGDLRVNRHMADAEIAALRDEELLNLVQEHMAVVKRYWNDDQRRVLLEEIRRFLGRPNAGSSAP